MTYTFLVRAATDYEPLSRDRMVPVKALGPDLPFLEGRCRLFIVYHCDGVGGLKYKYAFISPGLCQLRGVVLVNLLWSLADPRLHRGKLEKADLAWTVMLSIQNILSCLAMSYLDSVVRTGDFVVRCEMRHIVFQLYSGVRSREKSPA